MKKIIVGLICGALMLCGLAACGGSGDNGGSSSAAVASDTGAGAAVQAVEYDFYSLAMPEGFEESATAMNVFDQTDGNGSIYIAVTNRPANELLEIELEDEDFTEGDTITANGFTYVSSVSDRWGKGYYITDWEDGSIEVTVRDIDDPNVIKASLEGLTPAEDAYHKWQQAD